MLSQTCTALLARRSALHPYSLYSCLYSFKNAALKPGWCPSSQYLMSFLLLKKAPLARQWAHWFIYEPLVRGSAAPFHNMLSQTCRTPLAWRAPYSFVNVSIESG